LERKARGKARIDPTDVSPQVRKSHAPDQKSHAPLPRDVTFSGLSIGRPERDTERGEINKNTPAEPERIGPLAAKYLDHLAAQAADPDLAARQAAVLDRLRRPLTHNKEQQP
jgi:hypothetical protein